MSAQQRDIRRRGAFILPTQAGFMSVLMGAALAES